jgi:addiction module HigA family antidote
MVDDNIVLMVLYGLCGVLGIMSLVFLFTGLKFRRRSMAQSRLAARQLATGSGDSSDCADANSVTIDELVKAGESTTLHNPPHPGKCLKEICLDQLGVTVNEAAKALGVSRKTLSAIINGHSGISPEMAVRLSIAFDTSAESWLNQQTQHDLWQAEQSRAELQVRKLAMS